MLQTVQALYTFLGLNWPVNAGDLAGLASVLFVLASAIWVWRMGGATPEKVGHPPGPSGPASAKPWPERLRTGLASSRQQVWGKLTGLLARGDLAEESWEEVEELLYGADLRPELVEELVFHLRQQVRTGEVGEGQIKDSLFAFLKDKMAAVQATVVGRETAPAERPCVIAFVGINGAGKTTTLGKLAARLNAGGAKVVVGACDTFRAAAVEQLNTWCERAGVSIVSAKAGTAPSGVGHQALQTALQERADYCLLDTAGRLPTHGNLMQELAKFKRVLAKLDPRAPQHIWLVMDAITGQNGLVQAEEFHRTLGLTGLIFTKCDSSSRAGSAVSIVERLKLPIRYIGVGEGIEDLNTFDLDQYLRALLGMPSVGS